jgi:hypothetical protein
LTSARQARGGPEGASNLANVPVLVVLNGGRIDYNKTKNDGSDLRFVDANDSTPLDHEIENWDEAGNSYAHRDSTTMLTGINELEMVRSLHLSSTGRRGSSCLR